MRFNANRLGHLAGIPEDSSQRRSLNEAGNQSKHDEDDYSGYDYYKGDLNEQDGLPNPFDEFDEFGEADAADAEMMDQIDAMEGDDDLDSVMGEDEMVEINESMLRREIARMRSERSRRSSTSRRSLQEENQLRSAIRNEIGSIIGDLKNTNLYSTRDWLYGDKKPKNSRDGYVARGGFGIGF